MEERKDFEDIISSSKMNNDFVDVSSTSANLKGKHFVKKKRGIMGFFQKIGQAFKSLKPKTQKTLMVLTALILVFAIAIGVLFNIFNYNYNNITDNPEDLGFESVVDKKVVNIALFGIDSRSKSFRGNSDSIMVLSINTELKTVKIVSIVRDTLVKIEQRGQIKYRKINSAYAQSPELAIKTLNQNFGLDISEYATVNFYGMAEIIDAVGGIDVELVKGEVVPISRSIYALNGCIKEICQNLGKDPQKYYIHTAGKQHLNGIQAVAYSRIRKTKNVWGTNNDYGRTDRQRYVMEQLFNKALTMKKSEYIKLAKALMPYTQTSLSYSEIMGLAFDILLKSPTFSQSRVPLEPYMMSGLNIKGVGDCVYYDLSYASKILHAYFYENITPEDYIAQNGVEKNDWYRNETSGAGIISKPSTSTSNTSEPSIEEPEASEPSTSEPDVSNPDVSEPDVSNPDTSTPEESKPQTPNDEGAENEGGNNDIPPVSSEEQGGEE